jgi:hypothetical protein
LAFFVLATDGITTELHAAWGKHRSGRVKFVELTERDCHIER